MIVKYIVAPSYQQYAAYVRIRELNCLACRWIDTIEDLQGLDKVDVVIVNPGSKKHNFELLTYLESLRQVRRVTLYKDTL